MGDILRYAKRVTTEKRYSVLWEESSEAFPPNDLD